MGERDDQEGRSEPRPSELAFIEVDGLRRQRVQTDWKDVVDSGSAKGRRGEARAVLLCSLPRIRLAPLWREAFGAEKVPYKGETRNEAYP